MRLEISGAGMEIMQLRVRKHLQPPHSGKNQNKYTAAFNPDSEVEVHCFAPNQLN